MILSEKNEENLTNSESSADDEILEASNKSIISDDSSNSSFFEYKNYDYEEIIWREVKDEEIDTSIQEVELDCANGANTMDEDPIYFFELFIKDDFYAYVSKESLKYYYSKVKINESSCNNIKKKGKKDRLDEEKNKALLLEQEYIKKYVIVVLCMGFVPLPSYKLYWKKNTLFENLFIKNILSIKRYEFIKKYLHFQEDRGDKVTLSKIEDLVAYYNGKFKANCPDGKYYTIDETMVPFRGRLKIRQYLKNKPVKYGIKIYALADSETAYLKQWYVYSGREDRKNTNNIVLSLLKDMKSKSHIFMDSYFTSLPLVEKLHDSGFYFTCSIQKNKKGLPNREENDKLKEHIKAYRSGDFLVTKFNDNKLFIAISNYYKHRIINSKKGHDAEIEIFSSDGSNLSNENNIKPESVVKYNFLAKGVDRHNQLCSYYFSNIKSLKWYKKIFLYGLEACLVNAFILYKFYTQNKKMKLFDFRLSVIESLKNSINLEIKYKPKAKIRDRLRGKHFISKKSLNPKLCVYCKGRRSRYECEICMVSLCIDECFKKFHTISRNFKF